MVRKVQSVDYTSTWTYPVEQDGWFKAHDALRADMEATQKMLAVFKAQLAGGQPITSAQAAAAGAFFRAHISFTHHHHRNEEDIAMPYLSTRCKLPEKISADHVEIDGLLKRLEGEMEALLRASGAAEQTLALAAVDATFAQLHPMLLQHLAEEEGEAMPLMRQHFTPKEIERNVVAKIMRGMDANGVGTFFRTMSRQQRKAFAHQEGIPFFVQWILFHQANKYERRVWQPFQRECLQAAA